MLYYEPVRESNAAVMLVASRMVNAREVNIPISLSSTLTWQPIDSIASKLQQGSEKSSSEVVPRNVVLNVPEILRFYKGMQSCQEEGWHMPILISSLISYTRLVCCLFESNQHGVVDLCACPQGCPAQSPVSQIARQRTRVQRRMGLAQRVGARCTNAQCQWTRSTGTYCPGAS